METDPSRWTAALAASHERLRALIEPLDGDGVRRPAYPSEWSIAQVLSHLGSGAEIFRRFLASARAGADPPGREQFEPIWAEWNAKTPEAQAADGLASDASLLAELTGLDPAERDQLRLAMFGMDLGAVDLMRMRLSEHALHTWDVAVALDPAATVAPDAVDLIVDTLAPLVARSGRPIGHKARVRVRTSDPERDLVLTVEDVFALTDDGGGSSTASLRLPAEAFIRLVYGRLDAAHTPPVEAEHIDLDELRRMFPGF